MNAATGCFTCTTVPSNQTFTVIHADTTATPPTPVTDRVRMCMPSSDTDGGAYDFLGIEYWWSGSPTPTLPYNYTITPKTYDQCSACVIVRTGCKRYQVTRADGGVATGSSCDKLYLAQTGTANYVSMGTDENAGSLVANGSNIHLVEWTYTANAAGQTTADRAVVDGGCIDVTAYDYNIAYTGPLGAGPFGGQNFDAGL